MVSFPLCVELGITGTLCRERFPDRILPQSRCLALPRHQSPAGDQSSGPGRASFHVCLKRAADVLGKIVRELLAHHSGPPKLHAFPGMGDLRVRLIPGLCVQIR
jgi:hypothetical protein